MADQVIGLVAHTKKERAPELVRLVQKELSDRGVPTLLERHTAQLIGATGGKSETDLAAAASLLLVMGGDGTILRLVHRLGANVKPIFGLNIGSLGFLTCLQSENYLEAVESICAGNYLLSPRAMLEAELIRADHEPRRLTGLNDVVVSRGEKSQLIRVETKVDGKALTSYSADGLVIASPTGSTAYSLSAGGPILMPDSRALVITPICPHVLTNRSVVISDASEIEVVPADREQDLFMNVDGRTFHKIHFGDRLIIRRSQLVLPLAMLPGISSSQVLREKLKWTGSNL